MYVRAEATDFGFLVFLSAADGWYEGRVDWVKNVTSVTKSGLQD